MTPPAVLAALSRVATCADCCPSCRALVVELLEGPDAAAVDTCPCCGFPKWRDLPCPCERFVGQVANPASEKFKRAGAIAAAAYAP